MTMKVPTKLIRQGTAISGILTSPGILYTIKIYPNSLLLANAVSVPFLFSIATIMDISLKKPRNVNPEPLRACRCTRLMLVRFTVYLTISDSVALVFFLLLLLCFSHRIEKTENVRSNTKNVLFLAKSLVDRLVESAER